MGIAPGASGWTTVTLTPGRYELICNITGHYWTGIVSPEEVHFPADERTTYTDAAIILAADALSRTSPASGLFIDHEALPPLVEIDSHDSINNRAD